MVDDDGNAGGGVFIRDLKIEPSHTTLDEVTSETIPKATIIFVHTIIHLPS